jgi:phosphoribosylformylglycinamidine (FGAM) synthase-like enzyme
VRANMALYDYTTAYSIPCISGKDSMKNDYVIAGHKISIPPTVLFSIIGRIEDVSKAQTMDAKQAGDIVYVLGETYDELGGSEYFAMNSAVGKKVPKVDAEKALKLYAALEGVIKKGLLRSCHDCSDGGLGVALAETSFAGGLGMEIDLTKIPYQGQKRDDYLLFSESQSRFVVTVSPTQKAEFENCLNGSVFASIGKVTDGKRFIIKGLNKNIAVDGDISEIKEAWQKTLKDVG